MKSLKKLLVLICVVPIYNTVVADQVVIIVNTANVQNISKADVKSIYTDNLLAWSSSGNSIAVFALPSRSSVREKFAQDILGMSAQESARFWANKKITNTARNMPKKKRESSLVRAIAKNPNAIGYASLSAVEGVDGVRVLYTID